MSTSVKEGTSVRRRPLGDLRPGNWLVEALVAVLLGALVYGGVQGWRTADAANGGFPESLSLVGLPRPAGGYIVRTAQALSAQRPGSRALHVRVRYVAAGEASPGPFVVSVHPISSFTWAAVARGANGRCYGILTSGSGSRGFDTYYATFPAGVPCEGRMATLKTVHSRDYPR